jgi:hypothetical protein
VSAAPKDSEQKVTKRTKVLSDGPYTLRFLLFMISVLPVTHSPTFFPPVLFSMVIPKSQVEFMRFRKKTLTMRSHTCEPQSFFDSQLVAYDRPEIICVLLSAESPLIRF